jgi:hypothetical protein
MSPDPSSPFYTCPWKPPCNPLSLVPGRRVKGGTRSISARPARSVAARPRTSYLEHPPTSSSMRFDGRAQRPIDQAPLISAAGLPSDALEQLYPTNTFTLDTSIKAGPNFGLHAHGGVATHRHGWRMQGLRVPPVPKAARGAVSKPPPGPWISAAPTPPRKRSPPPIAAELEAAGLAHLTPKLVEQFSCSTVEQLLRLSATQLETLLDQMRLLPGRRQALTEFLNQKRRVPRPKAMPDRRAEGDWAMTRESVARAASTRARSAEHGPRSDLTAEPLVNWGRSKGDKERLRPSTAYISSVHVLRMGRNRLTVHGEHAHWDRGPTLNGVTQEWRG